jgi:AraC-like DNA-binding protein
MRVTNACEGQLYRKKDGFIGEKQLAVPDLFLEELVLGNSILNNLYITFLGYFPKAAFHFRENVTGAKENILLYCLSGKGWYETRNGYCELKANEFVIIPAGADCIHYGANADDPWTVYCVHFCSKEAFDFNSYYPLDRFTAPTTRTPEEKTIRLWEEMYKIMARGWNVANLSHANFCLYHFVASFLFSTDTNQPEDIQENISNKAEVYMKAHLDKRMQVDDFARHCSMSSSHFSKVFRSEKGHAPMDYFIQLKMQKACQLLDSMSIKIKDIACCVGYEDPYYFSRMFNKVVGTPPSRWKEIKKN